MKKYDVDVVIVGGGPAGMAAALSSVKEGAKTLLIERETKLGGILKQCIHSGFGLHYFGKELTGPEYAYEFIKEVKKSVKTGLLELLLQTFVVDIKSHQVTIKNKKGVFTVTAGAIVLAMGCRERTAGAIKLAGERPSGVWTAGQAQKWVNIYGKLPCKNPIILGSGDIGLIMARRLTFEGAKPQMVLELQSLTSGLARNIKQCLDDFNIPLYLNTTVVEVLGYPQIEGVIIAKVDNNLKVIENTKRKIACDGLILSVGLIPETDLLENAQMNRNSNSFYVNEYRETSVDGVFACGNVLHVHDLVDFVTKESLMVGYFAAQKAKNKLKYSAEKKIICGNGIRYTIPNTYYTGSGNLSILYRVTQKFKKAKVEILNEDGSVALSKFLLSASSGEMQQIDVEKTNLNGDITIRIKEENRD